MLYKYPRTYHLPWSPGTTSDDRLLKTTDHFVGKEVVVTEKMDGENTSMYQDHIHARSLDSIHHPSRAKIKAIHAQLAYEIPPGWRLCGENVTAYHSIHYHALPSYFLLFAIYNEWNQCLSWDETLAWAALLGVQTVSVLYRGPWDETAVKACWTGRSAFQPAWVRHSTHCDQCGQWEFDKQEGYVVRVVDSFPYDEQDEGEDFSKFIAKYVRKNHVQTSESWLTEYISSPVDNWLKD